MSIAVQSSSLPAARLQPTYKWLLALVVLVVLLFGWRFPALGFVVPVAMTTGMAGGLFRGRLVCGNLCPRGSLLDTWLGALPRRPVPDWMNRSGFRWGVFVVLIGLMVAQLAVDPGNWQHWGMVFWRMCLLTTSAALILAVTFTSRGWCHICPVGTVAAQAGGDKQPLQIAASCRACGRCEQVCPMQLDIAVHRDAGALPHRDCLKCSSCVKVCPGQALSWPGEPLARE
jgi:polyferredoxin